MNHAAVSTRREKASRLRRYPQCVVCPDCPTRVDCAALTEFASQDTDILKLSIEACRETDTIVVPSYRMAAEDYYHMQPSMSDFARDHRHLLIPGRYCPDPVHVEVYMHSLDIFREMLDATMSMALS